MTKPNADAANEVNDDISQMMLEHRALLHGYGKVQLRCSEQVAVQAKQIEQLAAQVIQLRAQVIARDSALAWAREDQLALETSIPGLPTRVALVRQVNALLKRVQDLLQERLRWGVLGRLDKSAGDKPRRQPAQEGFQVSHQSVDGADGVAPIDPLDSELLESSLHAADLVICQTGCITHGEYWRVEDHCKRTGKTCVLVEQPKALRIVRIHASGMSESLTGEGVIT